jgi:histidine phosphotransfer protein HptB
MAYRTLTAGRKTGACELVVGGLCGGAKMINWDRVMDLRDEVGPEDFTEIATLFLEEADEVVARLSEKSDAKSMESDLHFLKGSALNLGFEDFARLCQSGERMAANGQTDIPIDSVRSAYEQSRTAFVAKMQDLAA